MRTRLFYAAGAIAAAGLGVGGYVIGDRTHENADRIDFALDAQRETCRQVRGVQLAVRDVLLLARAEGRLAATTPAQRERLEAFYTRVLARVKPDDCANLPPPERSRPPQLPVSPPAPTPAPGPTKGGRAPGPAPAPEPPAAPPPPAAPEPPPPAPPTPPPARPPLAPPLLPPAPPPAPAVPLAPPPPAAAPPLLEVLLGPPGLRVAANAPGLLKADLGLERGGLLLHAELLGIPLIHLDTRRTP